MSEKLDGYLAAFEAQMRANGAARDFEVPRDMRIPEPMRPFAAG